MHPLHWATMSGRDSTTKGDDSFALGSYVSNRDVIDDVRVTGHSVLRRQTLRKHDFERVFC